MNFRSPLEATVAALVVLVGLLIGGMFAVLSRPSTQQADRATVATTTTSAGAAHRTPSVASRTPAALARTATPTTVPTPVEVKTSPPTAAPTATPTARPTATPTVPPTAAPTATPTAAVPAAAVAPRSGSWRIEEANVQVGTIVWSGAGTASSGGNAIVLDVHKESVAGHRVSACERRTTLHAVLTAAASAQTVPYREVNCSGAASSGEIRVTSFSGDGRTFSGSFWSDGSKLGDFTAIRL